MRRPLTAALLVFTLAACEDSNEKPATEVIATYGITVTLQDAIHRNPITGATITITEGSYKEDLPEPSPGFYQGARKRAGTYDMTIFAPTFETRREDNITVIGGSVGVETRAFFYALPKKSGTARLAPDIAIIKTDDGEVEVHEIVPTEPDTHK